MSETNLFVLAISHHGEKLRDTNVATSVWETREAALAELREVFADDLAELRELGVLADPCGRRNPDTEDGLLEALRWHHNVIVTIDQHRL